MSRLTIVVSVLLAGVFLHPVSGIFADSNMTEPEPALPKDECLLYMVQCDTRAHSIQDKIERLKEEIAEGTKVYTVEELRILREKLREASRTLDFLLDK